MSKIRYWVYCGTLQGRRVSSDLAAEFAKHYGATCVSLDRGNDACTIEVDERRREAVQYELYHHPWVISYQLQTSSINMPPRAAA